MLARAMGGRRRFSHAGNTGRHAAMPRDSDIPDWRSRVSKMSAKFRIADAGAGCSAFNVQHRRCFQPYALQQSALQDLMHKLRNGRLGHLSMVQQTHNWGDIHEFRGLRMVP